jgi:hypothetical protein
MITIELYDSGAAFEDTPATEIARILRSLAERFAAGNPPEVLRDINGNQCGTVSFDPMSAWTE